MVCEAVGVNEAPPKPSKFPPVMAVCQPVNTKFKRVGVGKRVDPPFTTGTIELVTVPRPASYVIVKLPTFHIANKVLD